MQPDEVLNVSNPPGWEFGGKEGDVIIKSAVYLARNFKDYRFPHTASREEAEEVANLICGAVKPIFPEVINLDDLPSLDMQVLCDKRYISKCFIKNTPGKRLLLKNDGKDSIAVNEEDHALISFKNVGLDFGGLLEKAFEVDDKLDEAAELAYDDNYGYITSLPSRMGTGLRATVLLHLPALSYTKNIKNTTDVANKLGMDLMPVYGTKEKEWQGNLFILSNHKTIGFPEEDIIKRVENFAKEIAASERRGREALIRYRKEMTADVAYRAVGLMERANMLTEKEALDGVSKLQLGSDLKLIDKIPNDLFGAIYTKSRTSFLRSVAGDVVKDIDHLRAVVVTSAIAKMGSETDGDDRSRKKAN